ncbi:sensor histidine kinase [Idiomarina tyrosinivorans]|nr:histidine kinase [Idiomarina tyrosinivorans]
MKYLTIDRLVGLLTWGFVTVSALALLNQQQWQLQQSVIGGTALIGFLLIFIALTLLEHPTAAQLRKARWGIALQALLIITAYWVLPFSYLAIIAVIWCAQLPAFMRFRPALLLATLIALPQWLVFAYHWQQSYMLLTAALFWTFNLFALMAMHSQQQANAARAQAEQAHQQLLATQALLKQASRQQERVHIARQLHDLLGHHLTALSINLQIAERQADAQQKPRLQQCYALAKLLLADVREAVSEIRDEQKASLRESLEALAEFSPTLKVHMQGDVALKNFELSQDLIRICQEALTNSLRHSNASEFWLTLAREGQQVTIQLWDNGRCDWPINAGNGIAGVRERLAQHQGQLSLDQYQQALRLTIEVQD